MTLWNIIRDFFVQYVFGGTSSVSVGGNNFFTSNLIGFTTFADNSGNVDDAYTANTQDLMFIVGKDQSNYNAYLGLGDWLSTTATIITLIIICVLIGFFVRWLFRLTSGLIQGRG